MTIVWINPATVVRLSTEDGKQQRQRESLPDA